MVCLFFKFAISTCILGYLLLFTVGVFFFAGTMIFFCNVFEANLVIIEKVEVGIDRDEIKGLLLVIKRKS